jgi:hypothetical protein
MTEPVIQSLQKIIKNFTAKGLMGVRNENVFVISNVIETICQRLQEVNALPSDAATDIFKGLSICSHKDFSNLQCL